MKNLVVLLDMDEVIVNTIAGFNKKLKEMYPEVPILPYEDTIEFNFENLYPEEHRDEVLSVWKSEGLFYDLELNEGAIEAIEEIRRTAKDVAICTSPYPGSKYCKEEKKAYVRDKLGSYWVDRLKITSDKTPVEGNILIDDKPEIKGKYIPKWEHVIYSHPWNQHINDKKRLTWANWKEVLGIY